MIAPQVCCTLISQDEEADREPAKVLRLILDFILSPAIIIYTAILYAYFIKIVVEWDLPKGGVAWMVMGFVAAALAGRLAQYVLSRHYYDWYYRRFTWIAIPPLVLYWVGAIYRIRLYSFTESRFYLLVAGALMTLFVLMLLWQRSRRFQLMTIIFGCAIALFTYIPGISAKSIGLRCQTERLHRIIEELRLVNPKTGKFVPYFDTKRIRNDSVLSARYVEACDVIDYVRDAVGYDQFTAQYGRWNVSRHEVRFIGKARTEAEPVSNELFCELDSPLSLGEYNVMLPTDAYVCNYADGVVTLQDKEQREIMVIPMDSLVEKQPQLLEMPERLLVHRNDSLLLVLPRLYLGNGTEPHAMPVINFLLFRKE